MSQTFHIQLRGLGEQGGGECQGRAANGLRVIYR